MALDQIETMRHFRHERFIELRVGFALSVGVIAKTPKSIHRVCLMDIAPTLKLISTN